MPRASFSPSMLVLLHLLQLADLWPASVAALAGVSGWPEAAVRSAVDALEKRGMLSRGADGAVLSLAASDRPDEIRLREALEQAEERYGKSAGTAFLRAVLDRNGIEGMHVLYRLCGQQAEHYRLPELHMACQLLLRQMLALNMRGQDAALWRQFARMAADIHPFTLPFMDLGPLMVRVLVKARGLAFGMGDLPTLAALDIILGTEITRKPFDMPDTRFWRAGLRGRRELANLSDWALQMRLSPYLGILDFVEGRFQSAMGHLSLRSRATPGAAERILYEQCVLYEGHSANLLGNFHLGINILRSGIRQATAGSSYIPLEYMKLSLTVSLIAQDSLEEALELVDSLLGSPHMNSDPVFRMCVYAVLAYYHCGCGRLKASYAVLRRCLEREKKPAFYYLVYHAPYFMELLYTWKVNGFPDIPGLSFDQEKKHKLHEHNDMQKSVLLRLTAQIMLKEGGCLDIHAPQRHPPDTSAAGKRRAEAAREAAALLRESLALTRELGLLREKAKACILLAWALAEQGQLEEMNSLAMEAWSQVTLLQQNPWIYVLAALVPAPQEGGGLSQEDPESLYDTVSSTLMNANAQTTDQFYNHLLSSACTVFGVGRACLLGLPEGAARAAVHSALRISEEEISSSAFFSRMELVEKCLQSEPVFTAIPDPQSGEHLVVVCIPLNCGRAERFALYLEGELFPGLAHLLSRETLLYIGRIFSWELIRFRQRPQLPGVDKDGQDAEELSLIWSGGTMRAFLEAVDRAAGSDAAIMLYGETGTGKELVARRIHALSGRSGPFIAVNLSALPEELFESELLGYERGAFTGAHQKKIGLLELAHNGTLFLDELPDISFRIQIKLLRILQERTFYRLGNTRSIHSDFRLITATNRDIRSDVEQGRFREDLFYRICVIPFTVPPLRERKEDLLPIVRYYMKFFARRYHKDFLRDLHPESLRQIRDYSWPGNVRELKNLVEQAVITASLEPLLFLPAPARRESYPAPEAARERAAQKSREAAEAHDAPAAIRQFLALRQKSGYPVPTLKEWENLYIHAVLDLTANKIDGQAGAASLLGMKKANLYYRLGKMKS